MVIRFIINIKFIKTKYKYTPLIIISLVPKILDKTNFLFFIIYYWYC
jgi:hypothetical protein